jgi:hypothetical protein
MGEIILETYERVWGVVHVQLIWGVGCSGGLLRAQAALVTG